MARGLQNNKSQKALEQIAQLEQQISEMQNVPTIPAHQWNGTAIRFQNQDGSFGTYVDLRGSKGDKGNDVDPAQMTSLHSEYQTACGLMNNLLIAYNTLNSGVQTLQQNLSNLQTLVNSLAAQKVTFGAASVSLSLLAVNATKDVEITFVSNLSSAVYTTKFIIGSVSGIAVTSLTVSEKTKETGKIIVTVKNTGIAVLTGSFTILLLAQGTPA